MIKLREAAVFCSFQFAVISIFCFQISIVFSSLLISAFYIFYLFVFYLFAIVCLEGSGLILSFFTIRLDFRNNPERLEELNAF